MMYLKGGQIIDPVEEEIYRADLEIEDGRIRKILKEGGQAPKEAEVLEVPGLMIAPGLVDTHVHFRDPGFTYKEDILTGARAAAAGGFTQVVLMANTKPCVDRKETPFLCAGEGEADRHQNSFLCNGYSGNERPGTDRYGGAGKGRSRWLYG